MKRASLNSSVLFLFLMLFACDNSIDPIDEDTGIFSIYGVFKLNEESNYIRIRDLNAPFTAEATQELDATVTLENRTANSVQTLESERTEHEGVYLHNFVVNGELEHDTEYRLTARRSNGASTSVTVITPTRTGGNASPTNQDCYTPIEVEFTPVNVGTIVYNIGFDFSNLRRFRGEVVLNLDGNTSGNSSFAFTPIDVVSLSSTGNRRLRCDDMDNENFYIIFRHYSPGFYEKIMNDSFDILHSTQLFGAFYHGIIEIPIDTSRVCPPDC